jgi:alpha-L-fucosidase 2
VAPEDVRLRPIRQGGSAVADFTVTIPSDAVDGTYPIGVTAGTRAWSVVTSANVVVERPNAARSKPATQSSTAFNGAASRAVDGNTDGTYSAGSVTHTDFQDQPWWQVDLGEAHDIDQIAIWNRTDCCSDRLTDFYVLVSEEPFVSGSLADVLDQEGVWVGHHPDEAGRPTLIDVAVAGQYVRVQLAGNNALSLAEVQVFTS